MAKAKAPKAKLDPIDRKLAQLAALRPVTISTGALDPAGADERLRGGAVEGLLQAERGRTEASAEGVALVDRVKAFVDAGLPRGRRDVAEQAAFFSIAGHTHVADGPCWQDFLDRWVEAGGLTYAIEVVLRVPHSHHRVSQREQSTVLVPTRHSGYVLWLLRTLQPRIEALDPAARAALREAVLPFAKAAHHDVAAALAVVLDDEAIAEDAIARAEAAEASFRDPWPIAVLDVLRNGETFARHFWRGGAAYQFYGSSYVLGARGRVPDAALADALVGFFVAGFAEPRRLLDSYAGKLALVACAFGDPRLAWLFAEHGKHKWLKKVAPIYAARHPNVVPAPPSETILGARFAAEQARPRPAGYTKAELDALDETTREDRLLAQLKGGHLGTAFALRLLAEYPTPRVAVAIHEKIHMRDFATQMPKPGFHKELQEDLRALAKKHPALASAIADAKKTRAGA